MSYGPCSSFRGTRSLPTRREWFPHDGSSFGRNGRMDRAVPTLEQMAQHWFYCFGTNYSVESFVTHVLIFYFQAGGLGHIWLIDSCCSRHMTGDQGWFSNLTLVV
jgi:hypothetical protein